MTYDVLIVGCGLSGLFAGCLAARRGKKTLILARGLGGTHTGTGTVDVACDPALVSHPPSPDHPYALLGKKAIQSALTEFRTICDEGGYPLQGELGKNITLPTAAGGVRPTCLIPGTMCAGDLSRPEPYALAALPGFRDFHAAFAAHNLKSEIVHLNLPHLPAHTSQVHPGAGRDAYATDLAHLFDLPGYRDEVIALWKPALENAPKRLGLPAILGLEKSLAAQHHLETALGLELFEIPIPPPSVPGMRLFNLLRDDFQANGGRLILGPAVRGKVEGGQASVTADANGRTRDYDAATVILATGGFLHGGLAAEFDGRIRDSVFGLPVEAPTGRSAWTAEHFLGPHPFAKFGLRVNKNMQPLDANGKLLAGNLRAIGSILSGADRLTEGSREGIELASAWRAVESLA